MRASTVEEISGRRVALVVRVGGWMEEVVGARDMETTGRGLEGVVDAVRGARGVDETTGPAMEA